MNKIETTHKIGDLVYTASANGIDRDVIKAVKVEGLKEKVSYGIKDRNSGGGLMSFFSYGVDGYTWYKSSDIFTNKEDADNLHNSLKAKVEAEAEQEKVKERQERLKKLEKEREALLNGEDYDPYEDD